MKQFIKSLLTRFNCLIYGVKYHKGLYVGYGAKLAGKSILLSPKTQVMPYSMIVTLNNGIVEVGEGTTVSMFSRLASLGHVKIGDYVAMGPNCFIADFNHEYSDVSKPVKLQGLSFHPTTNGEPNLVIGDGSWLGTHVVIVGNIKIGKHCIIGANSVVTHDIPDYCVAVGSPAKIIKRYNFNSLKWEKVN